MCLRVIVGVAVGLSVSVSMGVCVCVSMVNSITSSEPPQYILKATPCSAARHPRNAIARASRKTWVKQKLGVWPWLSDRTEWVRRAHFASSTKLPRFPFSFFPSEAMEKTLDTRKSRNHWYKTSNLLLSCLRQIMQNSQTTSMRTTVSSLSLAPSYRSTAPPAIEKNKESRDSVLETSPLLRGSLSLRYSGVGFL